MRMTSCWGSLAQSRKLRTSKLPLANFFGISCIYRLVTKKTLITHARTHYAQFLGYAISTYTADGKLTRSSHDNAKRRSANGAIRLGIPYGLIDETAKRYQNNGKPVHESVLINNSDAHIIMEYQSRFRGLAEYYKYAVDRHKLSKLSHVMEVALAKTLARKHKTSVSKIYRRYRGTRTVDGRKYKTLQVEVETKEGTTTIYWGAVPLRTVRASNEPLEDTRHREQWRYKRFDLIQRLQADTCELCGSQVDVQVHHVRKLSDLKKRWAGRRTKPAWVKHMIAMRRKTLMVCHQCHVNIHAGKPVSQTRI